MTIYGGVQAQQQDYTPTLNSGGGNTYEDPYAGLYWNPIQPKAVSTPKYNPYKDPMSNSYMGGGWENDPSIFGSGGLLGALRPFDFLPELGGYDPQLDDLQRTDPFSTPGNGTNTQAIEEAKKAAKEAAKNGGATNTPPKNTTETPPNNTTTPPATNDGPASRPWWHWAALAGVAGLGVWYLSKKKKKGKK